MARLRRNGVQAERIVQVTVRASVATTDFTPTPVSSDPKTKSA
jgi:hypothetical protein